MAAPQQPSPIPAEMALHPSRVRRPQRAMWIDAAQDITYGSIAGAIGKYIEYPFDTIKVRLQSQPSNLPLQYTGPVDVFRQSVKAEGFFRGLYRGVSAPVAGAAAENSCLFLFEGLGRQIVRAAGFAAHDQPLPLSALWFTGGFSGFFTSFVLTPIELVKCKIQVPAAAEGKVPPPMRPLPVIADIYRHQGIRGFFHGGLGTLVRETGGCAVWFGVKETVSDLFYRRNARLALTAEEREMVRLKPLAYWEQFLAGTAAGAMYNFSFFPADTIKSRMQTAPIGTSVHEQKFWKEGVALWRAHGVKGLYRGCGVTLARSPSSGAIFIVYDWLKRYMFPPTSNSNEESIG